MKKIALEGLPEYLQTGMAEFSKEYGFVLGSGGLAVQLIQWEESSLNVVRKGNEAIIYWYMPVHIFRAVGLLLQHWEDEAYTSEETVWFTMNGVMIDMSQRNALLNMNSTFRLLRMMAAMGLNMYMPYLENCFEVPGEEFFGYMRPRYTARQLEEIDDYAHALGIEVIPSIQTLGHLPDLLRWSAYANVRDDEWSLLVGEEKTYELIEKMLRTVCGSLRSKRVNIGLDEAWNLGLGQYLVRNGYRNKHEIFSMHLKKVIEVTRRLGLRPMMWGDMFFRSLLPNNGYYTMDDMDFPPKMLNDMPPDIDLIYWDYYNEKPMMENMFRQFDKMKRPVLFAGCVRNNRGFGYNHAKTLQNITVGYGLCKERGVQEVFTTIWGDNAPESNVFNALLGIQLCAEHGYNKEVGQEDWYSRFAFCCHCEAEAFEKFALLDNIPGAPVYHGNRDAVCPSRYLLWQDPMLGLFDKNLPIEVDLQQHYGALAGQFGQYAGANPAHEEMLDFYRAASAALAEKAELGRKLHTAYAEKDRAALYKMLIESLPQTICAVEELHKIHRKMWLNVYMPIGWEVMDLRYGALLKRLETTIERLEAYMKGSIDRIEELEEPQLPYDGKEGAVLAFPYGKIISANRI